MKDSLLNKVLSTISRFGLLQKADSVLISISGGPDSVFLASALNQIKAIYDLKLYCFHLDHKTRNGQSTKDAAFVKDFCGNTGLKLFAVEMDVKEYCRQKKFSFQDGARRLRLDLLTETAEKNSINKIATGHTADDNAETFLMHLLRGSGLRGLSGIQPVNGKFVRPLLEIFHTDILDYLAGNKIPYCSDKTNLENIYYRNKIRNILIPFINDNFSKNFVKNLTGTIDVIRQENAFIDAYGMECLKNIAEITPDQAKAALCKMPYRDDPAPCETTAAPSTIDSTPDQAAATLDQAEAALCTTAATHSKSGAKGISVPESRDLPGGRIKSLIAQSIKIPLAKLRAYPESVIKRIMISAFELVSGDFTDIRKENLSDITRLCFSGNERKELLFAGGIAVVRESENLYLYNTAAEDKQAAEMMESSVSTTAYSESLDFKSGIDKKSEGLPLKTSKTAINIKNKIVQETFYRNGPGPDIKIKIGSKQEIEIAGIKYLIEAFLGGMDFLKAVNIKSSEAYLDFEKIRFPVRIDYWSKKGERFVPLGLKDFKKLQDYFTDMKVPYSKRLRVPLFYDREKIIWVSNYRVDERVKIDGQTKKIFHIKIIDI